MTLAGKKIAILIATRGDAAKEQASPASVQENFRRFLIQNGMLVVL